MNVEKARTFVAGNHRAVLYTRRLSGTPQLSPVLVVVDGDGRVIISTRETAMKVRNVRRDPAVSLCVMNENFFGEWVQIDGVAEVVPLPKAMEGLIDYYRRAAGEHDNWDEYRAAMEREGRVLFRIDITRAGPDRRG